MLYGLKPSPGEGWIWTAGDTLAWHEATVTLP
jgi:hypothetical protein